MSNPLDQQTMLQSCPNCQRFFLEIRNRLSYLFDEYGAKLVFREDYAQVGGCQLIIAVKGMKIWFELDRGGQDMMVGPADAEPPSNSTEWKSPLVILDFIDNRSPQYQGPDAVDDRWNTPQARRASLEKLVTFYSSGEYDRRRGELQTFFDTYMDQFLKQVNEYYAKQSKPDATV